MKKVFAATYSTLSPIELSTFITKEYGLQNVQCNFLTRGVGDTYIINTAEERFIFRVYRHQQRTLPQIQAEVELLLALQNNGVSVSYPIPCCSKKYIQSFDAVEGTRYGILFSYAAGKPAAILTQAQLVSLAHEMARFHNVSSVIKLSDNRWVFDIETTLTQPLAVTKYAFADDIDNYEWLQTAAQQVQQRLSEIDAAAFPKGFCHFDFLPKNFHFEGDKVTFFDFDFFGYGWLVNDVMTFWQHLCLDVVFGRLAQAEADVAFTTFVQAYRAVRPLSSVELAAMPYLSLGFWIFYLGFYTTNDQFLQYLQPTRLNMRINLVKKFMERYWSGVEIDKLLNM